MKRAENIGIFLPNWVGDLVMATPALRAIRRRFPPPARLLGIMRPHLDQLLAGTDWLDESWHFDPRAGGSERSPAPAGDDRGNTRGSRKTQPREVLGRWGLIARMRRRRLDTAILLTNSFDTALMAWLGGAGERIGCAGNFRGPLLTGKVHLPRRRGRIAPAPVVDIYLKLAAAAGCTAEPPRLELATTDAERRVADDVWASLGLQSGERVIVFNSSGAYGAAKLWPSEHFAALARRIVDELEHDVLVVCGPAERAIAREIVARAGRRRVFSLADRPPSLGTTKACIARSRLVVSTDSGPRHIAAAFEKPVVTLMGPTLPVWIENPTVRGAFVAANVDCQGCGKRVCPLGHHQCMRDLSPGMVFAAVKTLLEESRSAEAA